MRTGEVISAVKTVQLFPNMNLKKRINKTFVGSVNMQNVLSSFKLADVFNLKNPADYFLRCIEGSFAMVADTKDFLELDYEQVAKILGSSGLQIASEVEIFTAANLWLRHNFVEREKYARQLLLKIRVKSLSEHALKHIQLENSAFSKTQFRVEMLSKLDGNVLKTKSSSYHSRRHCNRDGFNFLIFGGLKSEKPVADVSLIDGRSFKTLKTLAPLKKARYASEAVVVKDEIYVFGGRYGHDNFVTSLERYSFKTNTWDTVSDIFDHRVSFSACAFTDSIFLMGGKNLANNTTNACLKYDPKRKNWKQVSRMNEARHCSASVVFESNIVICGGIGVNHNELRSVEYLDVFANKWTQMPDMINGKFDHKIVSVTNKLFVFDYYDTTRYEIFDSRSNKFVTFREPSLFLQPPTRFIDVFSVGSKLVFFNNNKKSVFTYDMLENEWCRKYLPSKMARYTCVQVPWF